MPRRTDKTRQAIDEAEAADWSAFRANREEADRRLQAEGLSAGDLDPEFPNRWDQLFEQVCRERPLPPHPLRVQQGLQTWVRGTQLSPNEQRYVLELFPESRTALKLSPGQWLEQTAFRLRRDGTLDLRHRYCRINPGAGPDEEYRYHRAPRYEPLPAPPQRQQRKEWNVEAIEAIEAALLTRTGEGRGNYTERLRRRALQVRRTPNRFIEQCL